MRAIRQPAARFKTIGRTESRSRAKGRRFGDACKSRNTAAVPAVTAQKMRNVVMVLLLSLR